MATIMIVDDEEDIRDSTRTALETLGYKVISAQDGVECLEKLRKAKVDLVLLDFFMPEMSGREVLEKMRADPKLKNTKVAMMTVAHMSEIGESELKRLKVAEYIRKPIDLAEFKEIINKLVK